MYISVFVAVFRRNFQEVLLVLNKDKGMVEKQGVKGVRGAFFHKPIGWGCPGGGAGKNETRYEAALREVGEETGVSVSVDAATVYVETSLQDNHSKIFFGVDSYEGQEYIEPYHHDHAEVWDIAWVPVSLVVSSEPRVYVKGHILDKDRNVVEQDFTIYQGHRLAVRELLKQLGKLPT